MPNELTAETLMKLSVYERKALILTHTSLIDATRIADPDLHTAYKYGKIISLVAEAYFQHQIEQDKQKISVLQLERQSELIQIKTDKFASEFIVWLEEDFAKKKAIIDKHPCPSNLFELCGAKLLVTANSVTRTLSTKMGVLWEEIADISPYVIVPEFEFGIKITGIDIIFISKSTVKFAQLKTQKGTLTGSQIPRARRELSLHDNPLFIAAFDLGKWTFPRVFEIPRIAGKEFWDLIYLDYGIIESNVRYMLQRIDKAFSELAAR